MIEFKIILNNKKKIRRNRVRTERKWLVPRILSFILLAVSIVSFIIGIYFVGFTDYSLFNILGWIFAICLIGFFIIRALMANFTSHWISDRFNEGMWYDNGKLHHLFQISAGAGANTWVPSGSVHLYVINLSDIKGVLYDEKSKRIEFLCTVATSITYADYTRKLIDKAYTLENHVHVFYDYADPHLIEFFKEQGLNITMKTLDFKIRDASI